MPQVGEVIELPFAHGRLDWARAAPRRRATLRGRFDAAYVLPNSLKSALVPWLARIPLRVGYHGEGRWLLLNRRLANPAGRPPMVAFYSALAGATFDSRRAGRSCGSTPRPRMRRYGARRRRRRRLLGLRARRRIRPGQVLAGRSTTPRSRAPLHAARRRSRSLLLGSPGEAALCEEIATQAGGACQVLAGKTSLLDAMALIAAARGVVSNDSGLMHVAAALRRAAGGGVRLDQPAAHAAAEPERARVLWLKDELGLDCAPCFDRICRFGHTRCLAEVAPERVLASLRDAVARRRYKRELASVDDRPGGLAGRRAAGAARA